MPRPHQVRLALVLRDGQYRLIARTGKIDDLAGVLYDSGRPALTIEEINDAIAEGGAASGVRGLEDR